MHRGPTRNKLTPVGLALAAASLACAACSSGPPGAAIARLEFEDLPTPAMFERLCQQLRRPYVLELPPWPVNEAFSLKLERTTERDALAALERLDRRFEHALVGEAAACWPAGEEGAASPFARVLPTFTADAGAYAALQALVVESGLGADTMIQAAPEGQHRPVKVDVRDTSVRDILGMIAAQAHLGMRNEPGMLRIIAVEE